MSTTSCYITSGHLSPATASSACELSKPSAISIAAAVTIKTEYRHFKLLIISLLLILSYHRLRQAQSPTEFSETELVEVGDYNIGGHTDNYINKPI